MEADTAMLAININIFFMTFRYYLSEKFNPTRKVATGG